ncbi:MAG: zinc ribbon domain-containing protein [Lachnospiraceae bacterium]|nr:zinc ribbon domain-containing protein [Lachnospiraceae bacterium]
MAFCTNCGTQTDDNAKVCPTCGQAMGAVPAAAPGMQAKAAKAPMDAAKKKKLLIGLIAAVVAVLAIVIAVVVLTGGPKTFSVQNAVILNTDGYDTLGRLELRTDSEQIELNIQAANPGLRENQIYEIVRSVKVSASEKEGLSNGQEIRISVSVNEQLLENNKLKLAENEWTYTVSGLEEIKTIDPFEGVTVEFTGASPFLRAEVKREKTDGAYGSIRYELEKKDHIAVGETVKVTANYSSNEDSYIKNYGAVLGAKEKNFSAEAADAYLTSPTELDEQTLTRMQREALDVIEAYLAKLDYADNITYDALTYEGSAVLMGKDSYYSDQNFVWLVYSASFSPVEGAEDCPLEPGTINYFPIRFDDVIRYQDGTVDYADRSGVQGNSGALYDNAWWGQHLSGYEDTTTMMTDLIRKLTDKYDYELSEELEDLF